MSTVKLYLFAPSPPCRSVYMTAKALGLPLELKYLDFFKQEHLGEEFLKVNPNHVAPTIVDGDFVLWESRAIMRYLVLKYGGENNSLYPRDLQKRAVIDRLMDHDLGVFYKSMIEDIMFPLRKKVETTKEQDEKVAKAFEWLDNEVKDKKFLTGNDLTIADFAVVVGFVAHIGSKEDMAKYPNAMAWLKRIQELPYYKEINKPFYDLFEKMMKEKADTK